MTASNGESTAESAIESASAGMLSLGPLVALLGGAAPAGLAAVPGIGSVLSTALMNHKVERLAARVERLERLLGEDFVGSAHEAEVPADLISEVLEMLLNAPSGSSVFVAAEILGEAVLVDAHHASLAAVVRIVSSLPAAHLAALAKLAEVPRLEMTPA